MKKIFGVLLAGAGACFNIHGCSQPEEKLGIKEKVANAYGIDHFKDAKTIAFTFNIKRDTMQSSRSWIWDIPNDVVTYNKGDETVTYKRDTVTSADMKKIDGTFINDQYWLMFPFHLQWDSGMVVSEKEKQLSPINKKETTMITVQYDNKGGYTPGDAYDLYIDQDNMIAEWNYRKQGAAEPSLTTTWSDPVESGGMKLATDHRNADSSFRIYFTGVKVN